MCYVGLRIPALKGQNPLGRGNAPVDARWVLRDARCVLGLVRAFHARVHRAMPYAERFCPFRACVAWVYVSHALKGQNPLDRGNALEDAWRVLRGVTYPRPEGAKSLRPGQRPGRRAVGFA